LGLSPKSAAERPHLSSVHGVGHLQREGGGLTWADGRLIQAQVTVAKRRVTEPMPEVKKRTDIGKQVAERKACGSNKPGSAPPNAER